MSRTPLFERLGGTFGARQIAREFYARVALDEVLRPIYPEDLGPGEEKLALFFEQWLGGPPRYSERYGHPRLRIRHFPFEIDDAAAARWLTCMREALEAAGVAPGDRSLISERLEPLARHMVNAGEEVPRATIGEVRLS